VLAPKTSRSLDPNMNRMATAALQFISYFGTAHLIVHYFSPRLTHLHPFEVSASM
jgi:hypothetical protein